MAGLWGVCELRKRENKTNLAFLDVSKAYGSMEEDYDEI